MEDIHSGASEVTLEPEIRTLPRMLPKTCAALCAAGHQPKADDSTMTRFLMCALPECRLAWGLGRSVPSRSPSLHADYLPLIIYQSPCFAPVSHTNEAVRGRCACGSDQEYAELQRLVAAWQAIYPTPTARGRLVVVDQRWGWPDAVWSSYSGVEWTAAAVYSLVAARAGWPGAARIAWAVCTAVDAAMNVLSAGGYFATGNQMAAAEVRKGKERGADFERFLLWK